MRKALVVSLVLCMAYAPFAWGEPPGPADFGSAYPNETSYEPFSPDELDNLLAPIALYPDPLLAQVLPAATFVDQIDEAARWVRAYGTSRIDDRNWDVSVKAVAHYPMVLYMMDDRLDWTTAVGQAYVYQSTDVMASIQNLRAMANAQGNLVSTPQQQVIVTGGYIQIVPVQPRYIYVPTYDPTVVFFRPVYVGGGFGGFLAFSSGFVIGAWLDRDCDWRDHRIYYTGWRGGGWIARSRPHVHITTRYVGSRHATIRVNQRIVHRRVNYANLGRYDSVHRHARFEHRIRIRPVGNANPRVNNRVIDRNINTRDPRLDRYRGRQIPPRSVPAPSRPAVRTPVSRPPAPPHARPAPRAPSRPAPPPAVRQQPRREPGAFTGSEGGFNPRAASRRGKASREKAARPPAPRTRVAPKRPVAPRKPNTTRPGPERQEAFPGRQR